NQWTGKQHKRVCPLTDYWFTAYTTRGIPDGVSAALLPVTVTLDIITAPLQFLVVYAVNQ
ncbi:hypothetical protein ACUOCP_30270, partial [Escherichia sp. R-CC3]